VGFYALVIGGAVVTVSTGLTLGAFEAAADWAAVPSHVTYSIDGCTDVASLNAFDLAIIAF